MEFVKLKYFKSGSSLCGSDFSEKEKNIILNVDLISEISDIQLFIGWSRSSLDKYPKYFWIRMSTGVVYNCNESQFWKLENILIHTNDAK